MGLGWGWDQKCDCFVSPKTAMQHGRMSDSELLSHQATQQRLKRRPLRSSRSGNSGLESCPLCSKTCQRKRKWAGSTSRRQSLHVDSIGIPRRVRRLRIILVIMQESTCQPFRKVPSQNKKARKLARLQPHSSLPIVLSAPGGARLESTPAGSTEDRCFAASSAGDESGLRRLPQRNEVQSTGGRVRPTERGYRRNGQANVTMIKSRIVAWFPVLRLTKIEAYLYFPAPAVKHSPKISWRQDGVPPGYWKTQLTLQSECPVWIIP